MSLNSASNMQFKFKHGDNWHRFVLPTHGRSLFYRMKKRVYAVIGWHDTRQLYWDDGVDLIVLTTTEDLNAAIDFASIDAMKTNTVQCVRIVLEHPAAVAAETAAAAVDAAVQHSTPNAMPVHDLQDCPHGCVSKTGPKLVWTDRAGETEDNGMLMHSIKRLSFHSFINSAEHVWALAQRLDLMDQFLGGVIGLNRAESWTDEDDIPVDMRNTRNVMIGQLRAVEKELRDKARVCYKNAEREELQRDRLMVRGWIDELEEQDSEYEYGSEGESEEEWEEDSEEDEEESDESADEDGSDSSDEENSEEHESCSDDSEDVTDEEEYEDEELDSGDEYVIKTRDTTIISTASKRRSSLAKDAPKKRCSAGFAKYLKMTSQDSNLQNHKMPRQIYHPTHPLYVQYSKMMQDFNLQKNLIDSVKEMKFLSFIGSGMHVWAIAHCLQLDDRLLERLWLLRLKASGVFKDLGKVDDGERDLMHTINRLSLRSFMDSSKDVWELACLLKLDWKIAAEHQRLRQAEECTVTKYVSVNRVRWHAVAWLYEKLEVLECLEGELRQFRGKGDEDKKNQLENTEIRLTMLRWWIDEFEEYDNDYQPTDEYEDEGDSEAQTDEESEDESVSEDAQDEDEEEEEEEEEGSDDGIPFLSDDQEDQNEDVTNDDDEAILNEVAAWYAAIEREEKERDAEKTEAVKSNEPVEVMTLQFFDSKRNKLDEEQMNRCFVVKDAKETDSDRREEEVADVEEETTNEDDARFSDEEDSSSSGEYEDITVMYNHQSREALKTSVAIEYEQFITQMIDRPAATGDTRSEAATLRTLQEVHQRNPASQAIVTVEEVDEQMRLKAEADVFPTPSLSRQPRSRRFCRVISHAEYFEMKRRGRENARLEQVACDTQAKHGEKTEETH